MIYHRGESFQARVTVPADLAEVDGLAVTAAIHAGAPRAPVVLAAAGEPGVFLLDLTPETVPPSPQGDYGVSIWATWPDGDRRRVGGFMLELRDGTPGGVTAARPGAAFDIPAIEVVEGIPGPSAYEVAQAEGFTGTRAEWLASLVGELSPSQAEALAAVVAEVTTARGARLNLGRRIDDLANIASPNGGGVVSGRWYDNAFHGANGATSAGVANTITLALFYAAMALPVAELGVSVSTAVAGAQGRVVIYGNGLDGWPSELLYVGPDLDLSGTNLRSANLAEPFEFEAGRVYWVGLWHSSTATTRAVPTSSAINLGLTSATATTYANALRKTVPFTDPAPATWPFAEADLVALAPPSIRMRAA